MRSVVTDFIIDSIIIVMENYEKTPDDIATFLSSLLGYKGLTIYFLTLPDRILAARYMKGQALVP